MRVTWGLVEKESDGDAAEENYSKEMEAKRTQPLQLEVRERDISSQP